MSIRVKGKVHRAVVLTSILYGVETWIIYCTQIKKLQAYMMRQLRDVMNISWKKSSHAAVVLSALQRTQKPREPKTQIQICCKAEHEMAQN